MTDGLLLDTHIALWLDAGDQRLRPSTRALIDGSLRREGRGSGARAAISVFDRGFLFGDSVFEVLRTYAGRPFALGAHLVGDEVGNHDAELRHGGGLVGGESDRCRRSISRATESY